MQDNYMTIYKHLYGDSKTIRYYFIVGDDYYVQKLNNFSKTYKSSFLEIKATRSDTYISEFTDVTIEDVPTKVIKLLLDCVFND